MDNSSTTIGVCHSVNANVIFVSKNSLNVTLGSSDSMYKEGHAGLSLLLLSPFILIFKFLEIKLGDILATCILMLTLSSLPDIDIELRREYGLKIRHRGITHTLIAGVIFGIAFGALMGYPNNVLGWASGLLAGFGGTASPLLGDAFTYESFKPFYPFSNKEVALRKFRSSNKTINRTMLAIGAFACIIPFLVFP